MKWPVALSVPSWAQTWALAHIQHVRENKGSRQYAQEWFILIMIVMIAKGKNKIPNSEPGESSFRAILLFALLLLHYWPITLIAPLDFEKVV